jgi:uncharacterized membrane protein YozB (DUF420 family)
MPVGYWVIAALILLVNAIVYVFLPGGEPVLSWTSGLLPIASAIAGTIGIFLLIGSAGFRQRAILVSAYERERWSSTLSLLKSRRCSLRSSAA